MSPMMKWKWAWTKLVSDRCTVIEVIASGMPVRPPTMIRNRHATAYHIDTL